MRDQKWTYKKSVARAQRALKKWERITLETAQVLYEEKKQLASQKGQDKDEWADNFVPSWKYFCREISMPSFFDHVLKGYNSLNEFIAQEKAAKAKKSKRRGS